MDGSISSPPYLLARSLEVCPIFKILAPKHDMYRRIFFNTMGRTKGKESQPVVRPVFLLSNDRPSGSQKVVAAAGGWMTCNGTINVIIEVDIEKIKKIFPEETTDNEELLRVWDNLVDELTNQLIDAAYGRIASNEHQLDISRVYNIESGRNSEADAKSKGACLCAQFKVDWGPNQ